MKIKEREMIAAGWYPWIEYVQKTNAVKKFVCGKHFLSLRESLRFAIMGALAVAQVFCEKEEILPSDEDISFCFYHKGKCDNCILRDKQRTFGCLLEESTEESLVYAMKVYARFYKGWNN